MTVDHAISLLVEHRNGYSCYTLEAIVEARTTLARVGYCIEWVFDHSIESWILVFK
jgi:hypothetical protein